MKPSVCVFALLCACLVACGDSEPASSEGKGLRAPDYGPVPEIPALPGNEATPERFELGRAMFFDVRLSASGNTSCNSCHNYLSDFQDALPKAVPDRSYPGDRPVTHRNSTSFLNLVYAPIFRWDGSHSELDEVMVFPFSEANMNLGSDVESAKVGLKDKLASLPGYVKAFSEQYDLDIDQASPDEVWKVAAKALAQYLTRAVSRDSRFDQWNAGDDSAMDASEVRGFELFRGKARCNGCHNGPLFTDFKFYNVSTALPDADGKREDDGRFLVTGKDEDRGKFLTPTLRSTFDTAPYYHDGSMGSLRALVAFKTGEAVHADPERSPAFEGIEPLAPAEIEDLVAFLDALRGAPLADMGPPAEFP